MALPRKAITALRSHRAGYTFFILFAITAGLAARLALLIRSGRSPEGALSGGSDAPAYILLGNAISQGKGMAYAGQPTALRAPLYPLMLGGLDLVFGSYSLLIMRILQIIVAILTAWVCGRTAVKLWGEDSKWTTFGFTMIMPTLLFFTPQILTETFAAFLVSLFAYFLVADDREGEWKAVVGMGVCAGLLMLLRFNTLFVPVVAAAAAVQAPGRLRRIKRAVLPILFAALIVSPWIIRNLVTFRGALVYSSQTGTTALQGALAPQGRTQPDGLEALKKKQGWWLSDIETDGVRRLQYPSEVELNRQARSAAISAWKALGFRMLPLFLGKMGYFWLSTDQLFSTKSFSQNQRVIRAGGVLFYLAVLAGAISGWFRLRRSMPQAAYLFLLYFVLATALHLPFTMNTRLRVPLVDPLLCVLAGGQISSVLANKNS